MYIVAEIPKPQIHLQLAPERLCGCYCAGVAKDPDVTPPALRIQEVLSSHPKNSRRFSQTDVENDPNMNLQPESIATFYARFRLGNRGGKIRAETTRQREAKGVYRERSSKTLKGCGGSSS